MGSRALWALGVGDYTVEDIKNKLASFGRRLKRLMGADRDESGSARSVAAAHFARTELAIRAADEKVSSEQLARARRGHRHAVSRERLDELRDAHKRRQKAGHGAESQTNSESGFAFDDRPPSEPLSGRDMQRLLDHLAAQERSKKSSPK